MNLNNAIARAQRLMLDENWNRQVEIGASAQRGKSMNGGGGGDLSALEAQVFGYSSTPTDSTYEKIAIPEESYMQRQSSMPSGFNDVQILQESRGFDKNKSQLPKEVISSFEKTPGMTIVETGMQQVPASYFGNANTQAINEKILQSKTNVPSPSSGIDYKYIKYLIDESIKEHLSPSLNENVGIKGLRIANGNIIQFLDSKGNLYEGKLVLKKKAGQ